MVITQIEFVKVWVLTKLVAMRSYWHVLHVKPRKERSVCQLLQTKNIEVYYPTLKVKPVNPRARKERPFFPGYMFVYINLEELGTNALRWTEGTHGLVRFGGEPAIVSEEVIHEIQMILTQIRTGDGLNPDALKKGDRVRITGGIFEGYRGIFDTHLPGKDRVQVFLTYLRAQPKRLRISLSDIEKKGRERG